MRFICFDDGGTHMMANSEIAAVALVAREKNQRSD